VAPFSKQVLLLALLWIEEAKIKMLTTHLIRVFKEVLWPKYPSLVHCWGALDRVKIGIQKLSVTTAMITSETTSSTSLIIHPTKRLIAV